MVEVFAEILFFCSSIILKIIFKPVFVLQELVLKSQILNIGMCFTRYDIMFSKAFLFDC